MAASPQFVRIGRSPVPTRLAADRSVTFDATANTVLSTAHGLAAGDEVTLFSSAGAPGGLVVGTRYFVVNPAVDNFQVAATLGGAAIDLTTAGTAPHIIRAHNARLDGLGRTELIIAAPTGVGAEGMRIDTIRVQAAGTTTAGMIRLFKTEGAIIRLLNELAVTAATPSTTVRAFSADISFAGGLPLEPGQTLRMSTDRAELFDVTLLSGGEF
jgi:hypothetical protein